MRQQGFKLRGPMITQEYLESNGQGMKSCGDHQLDTLQLEAWGTRAERWLGCWVGGLKLLHSRLARSIDSHVHFKLLQVFCSFLC